eukprot:TRINITY_DN141_c0_g1_i2.p2 TRINITY_DN141_c0_g1~~TRINITY_DN141_c0_g1_i2.p2  ORF type:complete len:166 (-),score=49.11 TRINITY_DN141_c0_g1_i2:77-502(-)
MAWTAGKQNTSKGKGKGGGGGWQKPWNKFDDSSSLLAALLSGLGNGKGKGKGKGRRKSVDQSKTIWVGNLPDGCTYSDLLTHAKQAGNAKWAEVYKHKGAGTGAVGFASAEETTQAIMALNGSMVGNAVIQCDAWARAQKQ